MDYVDLYLIHWPGQSRSSKSGKSNGELRRFLWSELVQLQKEGLAKDIGVSNFTVNHLKDLLSNCAGVKPAVNQVEWHPFCHDPELKKFCRVEGILLQAYSSLGGSRNPDLISDPLVVDIAKKLRKEPAQLLLRWAFQQNIAVIPKARSRKHIEANIELNFDISEEDMNSLNNLQLKKRRKYAWDPSTVQ